MAKMEEMKASGRDYLICGDWNIAHKNEDIRNWKGNQKNSGFLPEERAWLDTLFDEVGFVDAFQRDRTRRASIYLVVKPWTGSC